MMGLLAGCGASSTEPAFDAGAAAAAVRAVLAEQVTAWNRGDLEAFMQGYVQTDSLRFASGGTVQRGWQTTLDRYRRTYPDGQAMGTLAFEDLDVRILGPRWAVVFGRWQLAREAGLPDLGGLFTLLFERRPEGWRIVHDHTSSASAS
jgi:ketosteroid isomerase-like protein